ncbi:MAG: hypothetical protein PWQ51_2645, partial [Methanolobus sp.]|nr:hypothetical protein [Methanolobus sp.]
VIELISSELPSVKKHRGPPVWVNEHARGFKAKYSNSEELFSMYIEDGFYVADIKRKYTTAKELLQERMQTCSLGKHIGKAVLESFEVLEDNSIYDIKQSAFRVFMRKWGQGK